MNVRRETPRPSDTACWPCGFSSIAPTRNGVGFQIGPTIFKGSLPVAVRSIRGEFCSRNDNKRVEESKGIQRRVTRTCPAWTTSFSFTRTEATRPPPGAGTSISIFIASMTRRTSPGWTESPAFTLTFTIIPGMSAVTSISVDPPGSKEFLDVRPFDALPLHRIQEEFRIVFLNPFDDAFGQLLVIDRDRVHRPMGFDVLQLHAVRLEESGQGSDLVNHVVLELVLRHLDVAATESLAVGKARVGADRHAVLLR